ncbi:hypothetical protein FLA_5493 [Filimonas lacunae]|nr:hypothetical protein FLA_5493 [Filimonas lacunae]
MCYQVIDTSLKSNLFEEWNYLAGIPWMRATLWDFYANVLVLSTWVCYKETSLLQKIFWIVLFAVLGSIGTCAYVLVQLFKLKAGEPVKNIFAANN